MYVYIYVSSFHTWGMAVAVKGQKRRISILEHLKLVCHVCLFCIRDSDFWKPNNGLLRTQINK